MIILGIIKIWTNGKIRYVRKETLNHQLICQEQVSLVWLLINIFVMYEDIFKKFENTTL